MLYTHENHARQSLYIKGDWVCRFSYVPWATWITRFKGYAIAEYSSDVVYGLIGAAEREDDIQDP